MNRTKVLMCWSGGKDSSLALEVLLNDPQYEVVGLLTTMTDKYDRISMHGVRRLLLEAQADALRIPLHKIYITPQANNQEYETKMGDFLLKMRNQGVTHVAFGDIFLEDLKIYREQNLKKLGLKGVFPIWKRNTSQLAAEFIHKGYTAYISCVDIKKMNPSFSGRQINNSFINDLPEGVDPCGENGEFHSFVSAGPIFNNEVQLTVGDRVQRDQFCFCDLIPVGGNN